MTLQNQAEMNKIVVKTYLQENAKLPQRSRPQDVGYDLCALTVNRATQAHPGTHTFLVDFGISIEPPDGYYFELIPRSSLAWSGFILPNSIGVIDPNYRGSLMMPLIYIGQRSIYDENATHEIDQLAQLLVGKRLAQLVLRPHLSCDFVEVQRHALSGSERGEGGFGSSGE